MLRCRLVALVHDQTALFLSHRCGEFRRRVHDGDVNRAQTEPQSATYDVDFIEMQIKVVCRLFPPLLEQCGGWYDNQRSYRSDAINTGESEDGLSAPSNNTHNTAMVRPFPLGECRNLPTAWSQLRQDVIA